MIISQTPFRVSFFGGGTDFPAYFREHGGAVLATTIDRYAYFSVHRLGPFFKHRIKASYARTETVQHAEEIEHPLIRESLRLLGMDDPLEINYVADLPGRTGIGSSSSFTVGLLHALHALKGETASAETLAREAIHVERERVGDPGGYQDQYAAAYGGLVRLDFSAAGVRVTRLQLSSDRIAALDDRLMLFYTGIEQSAEKLQAEQTRRIGDNLNHLHRMKAMVDTAQEILERNGDLTAFGALLHETWLHKRALAAGISNSAIDQAYEAARDAGALGGKLLGAGGRGFLLLYAEPECQAAVREALRDLAEVDFRMGSEGSRILLNHAE
jgi:D-glycero-alpha-D-manno-heptose-7-phosphate kinase